MLIKSMAILCLHYESWPSVELMKDGEDQQSVLELRLLREA